MAQPADDRDFVPRAWYSASLADFVVARSEAIFGELARHSEFAVERTQGDAWQGQIEMLQSALAGLNGRVLLEFNIPRMGRRVDAVVLVGAAVFAIEFKVGAERHDSAAIEQVWDYALDLKNFHAASHEVSIVPILVATDAVSVPAEFRTAPDGVYEPLLVGSNGLRELLERLLKTIKGSAIDDRAWEHAPYLPTPTIIEAARALYARHSVDAIARSDADAQNLAVTSGRIEHLIEDARNSHRKLICFVTGVPGAGKTLVGLNVATRRQDTRDKTNAVFLSGNGPLVAVLREALARDEVAQQIRAGVKGHKGKARSGVKAFIQNVHHFRDDLLAGDTAPTEHVTVFDEAQRAWTQQQTANFMKRRKNKANFAHSEPEFLIAGMDRHPDWAVIVCLVGGGQEINTGEAGIDAWLEALRLKFPHWQMHVSPHLSDSEYTGSGELARAMQSVNWVSDSDLHLAVSMRSFRAEHVSHFVKALLDQDLPAAREHLASIAAKYPIRITRDLQAGKDWVRSQARGSERFGLVCSSKALRLKPHAIDVRHNINPVYWFLNDRDDTRSSFYLEDAATEFQVQGLELDWACVTWDADLRATAGGWNYHDFKGSRWERVKKQDRQRYLLNAYRVLLTRARQGMAIVVPAGDSRDHTRNPAWYDGTYEYLRALGLKEL
ncbi:MAG: DUF2075 domain-containing protein [Planctomycetes bacterium]|nr:DUF2075 domain-containing protein [Planctomycetota bacterium]